MVSRASSTLDRLSSKPSNAVQLDKPAKRKNFTSIRRNVKFDIMEIIRKQFTKEGFSKSESQRSSSCRQNSTNKTYYNRLRLYFDWAKGKDIDPLQACEPQIADFLEFLFSVKKLQVRTIAGYKSAIAAVHPRWDGLDVGQADSLEKLLNLLLLVLQKGDLYQYGILGLFYRNYVNILLYL
jgi:hypothetical protein